MRTFSIVEAKAHLSELIEMVAAGDEVSITRRGKPVARLTPASAPKKKIDAAALRRLTEGMQVQGESSGDFMRRFRDDERY